MDNNQKRIVVKVGTSTLTHDTGKLNLKTMDHLVRTLSDLQAAGNEIILVTSGAIGVGTAYMGFKEKPSDLSEKQALAAIGQCRIMHIYDKMFNEYNRSVAQILLTDDDVDCPERSKSLYNTFESLLKMNVIPIVNENDSVSSAQIESGCHKILGDNDTLSAIVAKLCKADLLILLSDIDGLFDADPHVNEDARLIHEINEVTPEIEELAGGAGTWRGTGGMATKISAAKISMNADIKMVITNGSHIENLYGIVDGQDIGTKFISKTK